MEEKQQLETLEAQRLLRMKGLTTDDEAPKHKSADDIDDGSVALPPDLILIPIFRLQNEVNPIGRFLLDDDVDFEVRYDDEGKLVGLSPQQVTGGESSFAHYFYRSFVCWNLSENYFFRV